VVGVDGGGEWEGEGGEVEQGVREGGRGKYDEKRVKRIIIRPQARQLEKKVKMGYVFKFTKGLFQDG